MVFRMASDPSGIPPCPSLFLVLARRRTIGLQRAVRGANAVSYAVIRRRPAARGGAETDGATPFVIEESTAHLVSLASRLFTRALQERLGRYGVSVAQWSMLLLLWEEERLTQKELSRRQQIEEPTTTRTLQRMERDGLIRRIQDREDNRRRRVVLTERGASSAANWCPPHWRSTRSRPTASPTMRRSASSACSATSWPGWARASPSLTDSRQAATAARRSCGAHRAPPRAWTRDAEAPAAGRLP